MRRVTKVLIHELDQGFMLTIQRPVPEIGLPPGCPSDMGDSSTLEHLNMHRARNNAETLADQCSRLAINVLPDSELCAELKRLLESQRAFDPITRDDVRQVNNGRIPDPLLSLLDFEFHDYNAY